MNGGVEFNGLVGAFVGIAVAVLLAISALVSFIVFILGKKRNENGARWSKYFFLSSIILLFFDVVCYLLFVSKGLVLSREEAIKFDKSMLYFWLPLHLAGYILIAVFIRYLTTGIKK